MAANALPFPSVRTRRIEAEDTGTRNALAALLREAADAFEGDRVGAGFALVQKATSRLVSLTRLRAGLWRSRLLDAGRAELAEKLTGDAVDAMTVGEVDQLGAVLQRRAAIGAGLVLAPHPGDEPTPPRAA